MRASDRIYLLTGMHRSGTSFLAKRLIQQGTRLPGPHLPANEDNPEGYWEAKDVVALNNRILADAGLTWRASDRLSPDEMADLVQAYRAEAGELLSSLAAEACGDFAIKDPRFCRTLPVWLAGADKIGKKAEVIATLRPAEAVARSLYRRRQDPRFRPAAIETPGNAILLWLRYMLDLEEASRETPRRFVDFEDLAQFALEPAPGQNAVPAPPLSSPGQTGATEGATWRALAGEVFALLAHARDAVARARLDEIRHSLDAQSAAMTQKRSVQPAEIVEACAYAASPGRSLGAGPVIAFVSGEPGGRGHIYRIENRIYSLIDEDAGILRADPARHSPEEIVAASDLVIVFRKQMDPWLDRLFNQAVQRRVPVVFDIDDLLVRPELMCPEVFRYLEGKPAAFIEDWQEKARLYALAAKAATACWVTTNALADQMRPLNPNTQVLGNGLADDPRTRSSLQSAEEASSGTRQVLIGYASGTPTHDHDFLEVAEALADTLQAFPAVHLEIIGELSEQSLRALGSFRDRVSRHPVVDYYQLPGLLARFDINLAPLEADNVFCDCKSELKFFEAGRVGVPTIASATRPFRACIASGVDGITARNRAEWAEALGIMVSAPEKRIIMGQAARQASLRQFGAARQKGDFLNRICDLLPEFQRREGPSSALSAGGSGEAGFSLIEVMVGLAITAVISVLIFSSLLSQVHQADIVRSSTQSAFSGIASHRLVETVVSRTVPSWADETEGRFSGSDMSMSGMSAFTLFGEPARLQAYTLSLVPQTDGAMLRISTEEGAWDVEVLPAGSRFRYLGGDGNWHDLWPSPDGPGRTVAELERFFANQGLPRLICVWDDEADGPVAYQIGLENTDVLPTRARDLAQIKP